MNTDQDVVIGLLSHHEIGKFQEFIKNHWREDHLFTKETSVFDWQHKGPQAYHCMVAKQGEALVGVQGVIPLSQFDDRLPKSQIFFSLWKALEDRGLGIGLRLHKNIVKEYQPTFMCSVGIERRAVPFHEWQGFTVGVMDHHVALSPYVDKFNIAIVPDHLKPRPQQKKMISSHKKITQHDLQDLDTQTIYQHQTPLKSDVYIVNRYMNHPMYTYNIYALFRDDQVQALCVVRPISVDNSVVMRLVDFIGPNEAFPLVRGFIGDLLQSSHAEYVDVYSHGIPLALLNEAGFINRRETECLIIPNYFEPFERKNVDLIFGYRTSQTAPAVRLFKADGDQDRPSQIRSKEKCLTN